MLRARYVGILGIGAFVLFWAASFVLGALRPGYSHMENALSVLGAIGTPNAVFWNAFGFMIPGISLALVGGTVARSVLVLLASLTLRGALPDGLAQRTGNVIFMSWFVLMSGKLIALADGDAAKRHHRKRTATEIVTSKRLE
jgi:hypothetical membrane protein